jgi:Tol biopolymer transport system component
MVTLEPGTRLGHYEIVSALGEGGMGAVYRARDTGLHREVAIKVLLPAVAGDPDRLARFGREAQVLASLNHPNIAAIYGLVDTDEGKALVLELVEGPTLADRIATGPIPVDEALAIARQIADAVDAAHEQGIVHRDLKPANIKIRPDGTVKVLDFGLAKAIEPAAVSSPSVTMSPTISLNASMAGLILGTAAYMSPEQASGKPVDKRADIWAFGVVLWEMVTGERMFDGETTSHVLAAVLTQDPDLSRVPHRIRRLLSRCLEKDAKKRLRDIGDAMSLLDTGAAATASGARLRRWPVVVASTVAGLLALALGAALWFTPRGPAAAADAPAVRFQIERSSVDPYNNAGAAFAVSPDGRFLAHYIPDAGGRAALSIRTLATGDHREIAGSAVLSPQTPFWSPDSRQVAYARTVVSSVFDVVTGTTRELCACRFRGGSWNRDGVILLGSSPANAQPIRRASLDGGTPVALTKVDSSIGEQDSWPVFMPDARRFVFTRSRPGSMAATYMGSLDGDEPKRIADGARTLFAVLPGGAGPHLLGIDAGGLVAQSFDLATMRTVAEPFIVVPGSAAASLSDNGILATSAPATRPITLPAWFDRNGGQLGSIGAPGPIQGVALAADGRTVAVSARADTGTLAADGREGGSRLWLRDATGLNRRLDPEGGDAPVWSPDGRAIVVAVQRQGDFNMYERSASGAGSEKRIFSSDRNTFANDWSRDGRWVIYTVPKKGSGDLDLDLWVVPVYRAGDTATPAPYLTGPARLAHAKVSHAARFEP